MRPTGRRLRALRRVPDPARDERPRPTDSISCGAARPGHGDAFGIAVAAVIVCGLRAECGSRLPTGLANFIGFKGALDDAGDRAMFAARHAACRLACLGTAHRKLRFHHVGDPARLPLTILEMALPAGGGKLADARMPYLQPVRPRL